jgi:hypothetical protein
MSRQDHDAGPPSQIERIVHGYVASYITIRE